MKTKLQKFFTRLILSILGLCVIVVTLFLFLYVFWKGKKVFSLSFLLDKPAGVPLGTAGGIYPAPGFPESLRSCSGWLDIRF